MSYRLLLVAALALPLSACGGDDADDTTTVVTEAPADPMATDPMATDPMATDTTAPSSMADEVTVDGTIAAAGTDLTALPVAAATGNIDGWIAKLEGAQFEQAGSITEGLRTLRTQLNATPLDGAAIGATLSDLGEWTTAAAAGASSSSQEGLRTLGSALTATGERLGGTAM